MNEGVKNRIFEKIEEYHRILLFRHTKNDGDCVGATKGLKEIIRLTWPEKDVRIIDADCSHYLAFMGPEDEDIPDEQYAQSLGIVLDTAVARRISNQKFTLCRELIKIDHHIPVEDYAPLAWVEEERSSCCEMVVDFYATFRDRLKINSEAATHLYTGMITDSGRFKYSGVTGDTLRLAAILLDVGIDTDRLFAQLYLESYDYLKFKAHVYEKMQLTPAGVAYIHVDLAMQEKFGLTTEQASAVIGNLDSIRGSIAWIAFIDSGDEQGSVRVRIRSRFVPTNSIGEKYNGGGHAFANGATVYSDEQIEALLQDADALIREYKETHEGWL